jgi:hypothetical protein
MLYCLPEPAEEQFDNTTPENSGWVQFGHQVHSMSQNSLLDILHPQLHR